MKKQTKNHEGTPMRQLSGGLRDVFREELKDIYGAEKAYSRQLPGMIKESSSQELIDALTHQLDIRQNHVRRLEKVFDRMQMKPVSKKCIGMEGLIKESKELISAVPKGVVRDAVIILSGQKAEHYEIATYGALYAFAISLGEDHIAAEIEETLNEEKDADSLLTRIAELSINKEAAGEDDVEEMEVSPISLYKSRKNAT